MTKHAGPTRTTRRTPSLALACLAAAILLLTGMARAAEKTLPYRTDFSDGAQGWEAIDQAEVSDFNRREGGRSLLIKQWEKGQEDSAWLSPVLENPGGPVQVSLWAADNYLQTRDFSFSAAFELIPCKEDGTLIGSGGRWHYIPWDPDRFMPQFRHTYTREGLVWEYYEATENVSGDYFRLRFSWPKSRMKGECYFTDVRITKAEKDAGETAERPTARETPRAHELEISTPAVANLFYSDDPFRFEFLLYPQKGGKLPEMTDPVIEYEITDYERFSVAAGRIPFGEAAPLEIPARLRRKGRTPNLHLSALLPKEAAQEVGREFFLHATVRDGETIIAEDTITYGVVDPRRTKESEIEKSRFIAFGHGGGFRNTESKHEHQGLSGKMGTSLTHTWDYRGWKKAQPEEDGPINIEPGPEFPKLVYCPNLEQIRGRKPGHPWGDMSKMAPEWALLDDPFHPGCTTFEINGYVDYIVEYVRANRHRIVQVVPSGLERRIDARTLELQRKVYAALKDEFPDLPVGMMVWGILSENGRKLIMEEKLYEVADFFDTHVYLSAVDWTAWEKLQQTLKRRGIERRLISTEFARVGGTNQLQRARDLITSNLDAHAHDMYRITNFLMYVGNNGPLQDPILRGDFPGDGFQWMQYVDRPRISPAIEGDNWRIGLYGRDYRGSSLMPMLHAMSFYNFVQNVECADFKNVFRPTDRSVAYVYERDGSTRAYLFLNEPAPDATLALITDIPYVVQDLYGREDRVTPDGASLVVATLDPLALIFDGRVQELYDPRTAKKTLHPVEGGVDLPVVARGASGTATVTVPPVFDGTEKVRINATVDGTWPQIDSMEVSLQNQQSVPARMPVAVSADRQPGSYTFTTRITRGGATLSVLKQPLEVSEILTATMRGVPMTKSQDPAVAVIVRSLADKPMTGTIRLENRFFGKGFTPAEMEARYEVPPRGETLVRFPIPREQANLSSSYVLSAHLEDDTGFSIRTEDEVSFQASVHTETPITVDGDLSDWNLDQLLPIPFERWMRGPREPDEFAGHFYTRWDAERLYFAAVITDSVPVVTGEEQVSWNDDNIMFGIYPWRWNMGEPLNTGYYREHLGPIQGGGASFMRVGYVPSGPSTAEGAEIAVERTDNGWVYEWSYPRKSLYPLKLQPGSGFRLSMSVWDQHQVEKKGWGKFTWLTFSGFNTSVNAQPDLWRQFTFVK